MKQTIYIDVLVATNIFINYFLLLTVACFLKIGAVRMRLVAGAALGALYSLVILLPPVGPWLSLLMKLLMSATIVLLAFPISSIKLFLRAAACFYLTNFAFAGFMLAVWYFVAPQGMLLKNSVVYFNISPLMLLVLTVVCYLAVRCLNRVTGHQQPKEAFCRVTVRSQGRTAGFTAKIDTGNSLTEPFSGFPVVVAEYAGVEDILPQSVREHLHVTAGAGSYPKDGGFRLVPFRVVGGDGVLPAFQPEEMMIETSKKRIAVTQVYLAVCTEKLGDSGFGALLNPQLLSQGMQIDRKEKKL